MDMKTWKTRLMGCVVLLLCMPTMAQQPDGAPEEKTQEAGRRLAAEEARELERASDALAREAEEIARLSRAETDEVEVRMREAERRMAEAARQVAELSMRQLPRVERVERIVRASQGPVLGVSVGAQDGESGPVEGVEILGVSPGGAAAEAGLRAGDVITSINGESLSAENDEAATDKLLGFMEGVETGDRLDVEYLRNGKSATVSVSPRPIEGQLFAFGFDGNDFTAPDFDVELTPGGRGFGNFVWAMHDGGFGDMELVKLTERLGSYFGTDEGLLVVRAPGNEDLELEDGDVILGIDGRTPTSVSHAMRILGSYQAGEELKIEIMRDKRKRTIEIEMPDNRQSHVEPPLPPQPVVVPKRVVVEREQRT
jgi:C-terminal processing protease CtpA/Prc